MKQLGIILLILSIHPASLAATCPWLTGTVAKQYRDFFSQSGVSPTGPLAKLVRLKRSSCARPPLAEKVAAWGEKVMQAHSGKVGVVLPLTGPQSAMGLAIKQGMQAALAGRDSSWLVFEDSQSQYRPTLAAMARLRIRSNVGLWVVGGRTEILQRVRDWADSLRMPTVLLGNQKISTARSRYAVRVFPHLEELARSLAEQTAERGWKRVGVLLRGEGKGSDFVSAFAGFGSRVGVEIHQVANYRSGDFASMNEAVKHLFQVDPELRSEEFEALQQKAREKAESQDTSFNPRRVVLPGKKELDAVLIPDNFRIVRHFAKLFRYHKVFGVPLLGTPQWRSRGLVDPPAPTLAGSLFVDFVGPYEKLPPGLLPETTSPLSLDEAQAVDARLIGYRAASIMENHRRIPRTQLIQAMKSVAPPDPYFGTAPPFTLSGATHWPSFVFELESSRWKLAAIYGRAQGKRFLSSGPSPLPLPVPPLSPQSP